MIQRREIDEYVPPGFLKKAFHCPHCNYASPQRWLTTRENDPSNRLISGCHIAYCANCRQYSLWVDERMVYPPYATAPLATPDMPQSASAYYDEARSISDLSPRSAATLLRLAIKKLCEELGEEEPNLYRAIRNLQDKGLPASVIQSLDAVRIYGNEGGAHEGRIDLTGEDNKEVVDRLFWLVNFVVEKTITDPKAIREAVGMIPKNEEKAN